MFGQIKPGSLRSGSIILFQTALGAGALSLPFKAKQIGIISLLIIMVLTSILI